MDGHSTFRSMPMNRSLVFTSTDWGFVFWFAVRDMSLSFPLTKFFLLPILVAFFYFPVSLSTSFLVFRELSKLNEDVFVEHIWEQNSEKKL